MLFFCYPGPKYVSSFNRLNNRKISHTFSYQTRLYKTLYFSNQARYICLKSGLFTYTLAVWNSVFSNQNWWLKRFHVSKWKCSGFGHPSSLFKYCIFSNKHSRCLLNFETVRCGSCKRTVLIRGRRLFRSYWNGKY